MSRLILGARRQAVAADGAVFVRRSMLGRFPLRAKAALGVLLLLAAVAVAAPVLPLANPLTGDLGARLLPFGSSGHPLGTDSQGRDMVARLVFATRTSLIAGVVPILIATTLGLLIGTVAGLGGRWTNAILMRGVDILFAFPGVLLALLLAISFGVGLGTLILALTVVWIAPIARIAETEVARIRELDFVLAARSSGASAAAVLVRQVVPVVLPAVVAYATSLVGANIAIGGGLGFIGLGVPSPEPELGAMLQEMQTALYVDPTLALAPVVVILALSVLFPLVGDGIRESISGRGGHS